MPRSRPPQRTPLAMAPPTFSEEDSKSTTQKSPPLQPTLTSSTSSGSTANALSSSLPTRQRRRAPNSVTQNACLNCKKARSKCDGKTPCTRCSTRSEQATCVYEVHVKHAKEQLVREIQDFRAKEKLVTIFLKALQSKDQTPNLLRALRSGEAMESIVERLAGAQPGKMENGASPATSHISAYATSEAKDHYFQHFWTGVTNDSSVVEHLFRLYFSWVHPVSMLFEERQFLESYHRQKRDFCSTGLVDAICALACNLHTPSDDDEDDYGELSTRFADAYRDNFDPLDRSITTIQATAVMFLVELAKGSGRAGAYLKLATGSIMEVASMGRTIPSVVLRTTIQGIRCLNVEWAQATFESPMILSSATYEYCMAHDQFDNSLSDEESWHHYTSSSNSNPCGPSLLATLNSEKLKLMNIIGDVCNMMYGSSSAVITARDILKTYSRFIDWRKNLPPCIAEDKHSQSLPHVISLMISYNHSITQLLRPLIDLQDFPSMLVEEEIFVHAQRALFLLEHYYRKPFTCRYQPSLQLFLIVNVCDIIARFFPAKAASADLDGPEALLLGLRVLEESYANGRGSPVASVLQEQLRLAAAQYSPIVKVPPGQEHDLNSKTSNHPDCTYEMVMDACTRAVYFQPLWGVREKFDKKMAQDWCDAGPSYGFQRPRGDTNNLRSFRSLPHEPDRSANYLMQIQNLLNSN